MRRPVFLGGARPPYARLVIRRPPGAIPEGSHHQLTRSSPRPRRRLARRRPCGQAEPAAARHQGFHLPRPMPDRFRMVHLARARRIRVARPRWGVRGCTDSGTAPPDWEGRPSMSNRTRNMGKPVPLHPGENRQHRRRHERDIPKGCSLRRLLRLQGPVRARWRRRKDRTAPVVRSRSMRLVGPGWRACVELGGRPAVAPTRNLFKGPVRRLRR